MKRQLVLIPFAILVILISLPALGAELELQAKTIESFEASEQTAIKMSPWEGGGEGEQYAYTCHMGVPNTWLACPSSNTVKAALSRIAAIFAVSNLNSARKSKVPGSSYGGSCIHCLAQYFSACSFSAELQSQIVERIANNQFYQPGSLAAYNDCKSN